MQAWEIIVIEHMFDVNNSRANRPISAYLDFLLRFPNLTCIPLDIRAAEICGRHSSPDGDIEPLLLN